MPRTDASERRAPPASQRRLSAQARARLNLNGREAEAARARYVLVPEPARPDGGVVTGRYAIARFNLRTTGRPSEMAAERPIMISKLLCISYFILHFACFVKMCSVLVFIM